MNYTKIKAGDSVAYDSPERKKYIIDKNGCVCGCHYCDAPATISADELEWDSLAEEFRKSVFFVPICQKCAEKYQYAEDMEYGTEGILSAEDREKLAKAEVEK